MSKSLLNDYHRSWLFANYANKSNEELAILLTEMVAKENSIEIERLKARLQFVTSLPLRRRIEKEIEKRENFKPYTADSIKKLAARIGCPKKSMVLTAEANRAKALATNIKKWEKIAQPVGDPLPWLRSFSAREVRIVRVMTPKEKRKIQDAIFNYNNTESIATGLVFSSEAVRGTKLMRVVALPNALIQP